MGHLLHGHLHPQEKMIWSHHPLFLSLPADHQNSLHRSSSQSWEDTEVLLPALQSLPDQRSPKGVIEDSVKRQPLQLIWMEQGSRECSGHRAWQACKYGRGRRTSCRKVTALVLNNLEVDPPGRAEFCLCFSLTLSCVRNTGEGAPSNHHFKCAYPQAPIINRLAMTTSFEYLRSRIGWRTAKGECASISHLLCKSKVGKALRILGHRAARCPTLHHGG